MALESLQKLYNGVSEFYDIGDFNTFKTKMQNPDSRRSFYDQVSKGLDIGDYETFEIKVSSPSPSVDLNDVFIDPDEKIIEPEKETNLQKIIRGLEQNKTNPQYILKNSSGPNSIENLSRSSSLPKFVMGVPVSSIPGIESKQSTTESFIPTDKDVAEYEKTRFFKKEIAKEKKKGLSDYDAYNKIRRQLGLPREIFDSGFEQSITGSLFRIFGLEQASSPKLYQEILQKDENLLSPSKFEELLGGAISLLQPVDAFLFKGGGVAGQAIGKLKTIAKTGDRVANTVSKVGKIPLPQARIFTKNAIQRITGGAGGFAAFDAGRDLTSQIEETGTVKPFQTVVEALKGSVVGSFTSGLGLVGTVAGKKSRVPLADKGLEFAGEIFGLGTVSPLLDPNEKFDFDTPEGKKRIAERYLDAAGTIIGLKVLKTFTPQQAETMKKITAEEAFRRQKKTGKQPHEVFNEMGNQIKTALEIALENKTAEKNQFYKRAPNEKSNRAVTEYEVVESTKSASELKKTAENLRKQGIESTADFVDQNILQDALKNLKQISKRETSVDQLRQRVEELRDRNVPENEIQKTEDFKQLRQQEALLFEKPNILTDIESLKRQGFSQSEAEQKAKLVLQDVSSKTGQIALVEGEGMQSARVQLNLEIKRIAEDMKALEKNGVDQIVLDQMQQSIDGRVATLNKALNPNPLEINKALNPKETPTAREIIAEINRMDKLERERYNKYLIEKDKLNRPFEPNPFLEVPLHPVNEALKAIKAIEKRKLTVQELPAKDKLKGYQIQKEFTDLDLTVKNNEQQLKNPNLTDIQREKLQRSGQKARELLNEVREQAESNGIELQMFMGIPTPSILKSLFGSSKKRPRSLKDAEVDRLYNNAMKRLSSEKESDYIQPVEQSPKVSPPYKVQSIFSKAYNYVFSDMGERVAAVGTPTSIEAGEMFKKAIDISKQTSGEMAPILGEVLTLAGKGFGEQGKVNRNLADFKVFNIGGNEILLNKMHAKIEGLIPVKPSEVKTIEKMKDLIEKRGFIFEKNNLMQEGKDGVVSPFLVRGRNIAPRVMSNDFYRILELGSGSTEFNTMVSDFAKANATPVESVSKYFTEFTRNLNGDSPESPTRTTQAEHSRYWKQIPHAIKVNGETIPLVEYRPFEYAQRLVETGANRIGVVRTFGQELNNTSIINEMKNKIQRENGTTIQFHEMIKALSGVPVDMRFPYLGEAGMPFGLSRAYRGVNSIYRTIKSTSLSVSGVLNIPEFLGNTRKFAGTPSLVKALYKTGFGFPTTRAKKMEALLTELGAYTVDVTNIATDPRTPLTSRLKVLPELARSVFLYRYINEYQEKVAGVVAMDRVERFKKGKGKGTDEILMEEMGFTRDQAKIMVEGKAPEALYNELIRRAPARLVGAGRRVGEQSRLESNRIFQAGTEFQSYAQMKAMFLNRAVFKNKDIVIDAIAEKNYSKLLDVMKLAVSDVGGNIASGVSAQFLLAYFYGGADNVEIKWNEAKDKPFEFLFDAWAYTTFAGMYGAVLQSTATKSATENILNVSYPYVVANELADAVLGKGRYTYYDGVDKAIKFTERFLPANRVAKQVIVASGLGSPEAQKTDNAIRAYYRWKIDNKYGGKYTSVPEKEIVEFRKSMKKVYDAIVNKEEPKVIRELLISTAQQRDKKGIVQSLRGRQLLSKSKIAPGASEKQYTERKDELKNRIGEEAYKRLLMHDKLLETYAKLIGKSPRG
tara:strand:- start:408 stop:5579 length:5172 start_codon:yes stop_codon:yes gene_type:complete